MTYSKQHLKQRSLNHFTAMDNIMTCLRPIMTQEPQRAQLSGHAKLCHSYGNSLNSSHFEQTSFRRVHKQVVLIPTNYKCFVCTVTVSSDSFQPFQTQWLLIDTTYCNTKISVFLPSFVFTYFDFQNNLTQTSVPLGKSAVAAVVKYRHFMELIHYRD